MEQNNSDQQARARAYWHANLKLVGALLATWFAVSYGAGILFVDALNEFHLFGFPLGFWFAQQGSIYTFVILIFVYVHAMRRIERRLDVSPDDSPPVIDNTKDTGA